jgi:hypothetical protein
MDDELERILKETAGMNVSLPWNSLGGAETMYEFSQRTVHTPIEV